MYERTSFSKQFLNFRSPFSQPRAAFRSQEERNPDLRELKRPVRPLYDNHGERRHVTSFRSYSLRTDRKWRLVYVSRQVGYRESHIRSIFLRTHQRRARNSGDDRRQRFGSTPGRSGREIVNARRERTCCKFQRLHDSADERLGRTRGSGGRGRSSSSSFLIQRARERVYRILGTGRTVSRSNETYIMYQVLCESGLRRRALKQGRKDERNELRVTPGKYDGPARMRL